MLSKRNLVVVLLMLIIALTVGSGVVGAQADPSSDTVGWENGYWYNESVTISDSDERLRALKNRGMARVEQIRGVEFESNVPLDIQTRESYQKSNPFEQRANSTKDQWNQQVWEALFILGENNSPATQSNELTSSQVVGYYTSRQDKMVVIKSGDGERFSESTLVHELAHALQDERFNISTGTYSGETQDEQIAIRASLEGEATYIENQYRMNCRSEGWECQRAVSSGSGTSGELVTGYQQLFFFPYVIGLDYVEEVVRNDGLSATDKILENPPQSTRQLLDGKQTKQVQIVGSEPGDWSRFNGTVGQNGTETVGQASVAVMFWQASERTGVNIVPQSRPYSAGLYSQNASDGLVGDVLVPYKKNSSQNGYVWKTEWQTKRDADEFEQSYVDVIEAHGGTTANNSTWVIEDSAFADSFIIEQYGETVYITNGPTVEEAQTLSSVVSLSEEDRQTGFPVVLLLLVVVIIGLGLRRTE